MNDTQEVTLDTERLEAKLTQEVTLDTEKLEAKLTSSDFAQVIFQNVAESYPPDADIICHYTLTESIVPSTSDWIGLFKVGWTSARGYHTFNYVQPPATQEGKQKTMSQSNIQFSAYYLPKEDGEFYQFVYVNKNAEVRGASTPFQFRSPSADDFIEIEDENTDMLMIKTKTVFCEERLNQTRVEKNTLQRQLIKCKEERDEVVAKIAKLEKEMEEKEKNYVQLEGWYKKALSSCGAMENEKCVFEARVKKMEVMMKENVEEKDALTVELANLKDKLKQTEEEKSNFQGQLNKCEEEKDEVLKRIEKLEHEIDEKDKNYVQIEGWYKKALSSSGAMEKEKSVFEARVKQMEMMLKENMEEKDALAVELAKLKDEMKQSEATLLDICNEKVELEKKIVELEEQIELYKDHFTTSEKENIKLKEEIETLRGQLSENDAALVKTKEDSIQLKSVVDEEKKKFERQLHVTNADKTHILSLEDKVKNYEDKIAALEDTKKLVTTELETLRQVQQNLSTNLEDKTGEVLTMKTKFKRQKSMSAEKEAELQEEIRALRDGLTQLAKEKEKLVNEVHTLGKQQEGPLYALQEANKHMRQKYNKLKKQHEGCVKERSELVTKQVAIELQNSDLTREIEDLRERLNMGAEAWKEKYKECQKLTTKIKKIKRKSVTTESDALQGAVAIATKESGVQAADSEQEESYNSMLHVQLNDLAKALEERNEQCKRYEEILQSEKTNMEKTEMKVLELDEKYQDSVKRYADAEKELNELKKKIKEAKRQNEAQEEETMLLREELKREIKEKQDKDEAYVSLLKQVENSNMSLRMPESINNNNAPAANPFENMFINPYVDEARELRRQHEVVTRGIHYNMHSPRSIPPPIPPPRPRPGYVMPMVPPTTPDLLPECFGAAAASAPLPPPMRPTVLPQAKLAAVKNETRTAADAADQSDSDVYDEPDAVTPQETVTIQVDGHVPEERDDVATEFHDAQEFPADRAARWCPECNLLFPPSCPSDTFEQHVQSHFGRVCPMCRKQFPKDSCDQDAFENHVQTHFERE